MFIYLIHEFIHKVKEILSNIIFNSAKYKDEKVNITKELYLYNSRYL